MSDKPLIVVQPGELNQLMDTDNVIRVHPDGRVSEPDGIWAPELHEGDLSEWKHVDGQPVGWSLMSGYSGQYGYSGPIMHPSEFVGAGFARDILAEPGLYVAIVNWTYEPTDGCAACRATACSGHESFNGADMGRTVHCDGTCAPLTDASACDEHDVDGWAVAYIADPCNDSACLTSGCPEHVVHDGDDHTYEQHHGRTDHVGPDACRCTG